ncbi:hypothetical protein Tco_0396064 [Tanacetum coccineum]
MAVLESCPKHNMVAYLEKTDGNTEFHEIISFLMRSSIHYALTVSPVVSTTFVEQFWMSAKSKIINNVRYITTKVAGKPVSILEASIRSDLLFDDADGIDSLPNQAIFDLKNVPAPLDHFPINDLTSKVFSFMVKKGKHFSGNVTPLFDSMLVQPTENECDTLERQSEPQPIPSPPHLSKDQHETQTDPSPRPSPTTHILDFIPEGSSRNHGDQAKEIKHLKAQIKKLKKKAKPVITHHKAWMKSVSMKQRLAGKKSLKKQWMQKESVSKQGRKPAKAEPTVHKYPTFDELDDDYKVYWRLRCSNYVGGTSYWLHEEKESAEKGVSTEDPLSTAQPKHVGGKKHSDLKTKGFEEIKALYDKIKRSDDSFIAIGSAKDEKVIKEMNEQVADASKKRVKKDDSIKGEIKEEEGTRKRKLGIRKKMKSKKRKFTSKDDEELRLCLTIVSDEDKEVDYEILDKKYPIIEWRSEYLTTKPQYDETEEIEDVYLNVVIRSNRQRRYFSTLMAVLSILDRDDICAIYQLVMNRYQDETPEGFDKILWGDLIIIFVKKQIAELEPEDSDGDEKDL